MKRSQSFKNIDYRKIPIEKRSTTRFVVELTDGWYSVGWKVGQNDDPFRFPEYNNFILFILFYQPIATWV